MQRTALRVDDPIGEVTAVVHEPEDPTGPAVLLAPGAGGDLDSTAIAALAEVVAGLGCAVVRCNLPHHEAGRPAQRAERSVRAFVSAFEDASERVAPGRTWVVGGKSYGGRVASLAVGEDLDAIGLLFYGYPLHPPGEPDRLRVDHWSSLGVPTLFLQGTRDPFCDLDLLQANVPNLAGPATVELVHGGDHSLEIAATVDPEGRRRGAAETLRGLAPAIDRWLGSLVPS